MSPMEVTKTLAEAQSKKQSCQKTRLQTHKKV